MKIPWDRDARSSVGTWALGLVTVVIFFALFSQANAVSRWSTLGILALAAATGGLIGYFKWFLEDREVDSTNDLVKGQVSTAIPYPLDLPLHVRPRAAHVYVFWGGLIWFGFSTLFMFVSAIYFTAPGMALVALLSLGITLLFLVPALFYGRVEMDEAGIRHHCPFGTFGMLWDDVEAIEYATETSNIVLRGSGKRLPIPAPGIWAAEDRDLHRNYLFGQLQARGVVMRTVSSRHFTLPKNVRVQA